MSMSELQACLARLYIDENFRRLFYIQSGVLSEYLLTDVERAAVEQIDRHMLDFFASSLRRKRRERIARAYPATFQLDGKALDRYWHRYCAIFITHGDTSFEEEAKAFGHFLWESLVDPTELPPFARDLVLFELEDFQARDIARRMRAIEAPQEGPTQATPRSVPRLRDGARLRRFSYDIPVIEDELQRNGVGAATSAAELGQYAFVFFPPSEFNGVATMRLSAPLARVLEQCDGTASVAEIVAATETTLHVTGLLEPILDAIDKCWGRGIIQLDRECCGESHD
jgi:hypothetical protein